MKTLKQSPLKSSNFNTRQGRRYVEKETGFILPDKQWQLLVNAVDNTASANGLLVRAGGVVIGNELSTRGGARIASCQYAPH